MFPGMGGLDPKKMQAVMKQMGISQDEIDASRVTIEKTDGNKITINNPSITKIVMQGQESFQISGEVTEDQGTSEEDVTTVMEKTSSTREQAEKALENSNGDLAEAILELSK
ncbi:MAG: Nascent polypeptide-associated complex protein [Nanoarchaeota archaeon]|nr:Nascent polypeptide-associated complex protein [Nanoarchaeota archaeon]